MRLKITLTALLFSSLIFAQQEFKKSFEHFEISRGDSSQDYILTLPQEEIVKLMNQMQNSSGLGPTFNYFGTTLVVDQMDKLPNGKILMIVRREDGKDFFGYAPTLKAVLKASQELTAAQQGR